MIISTTLAITIFIRREDNKFISKENTFYQIELLYLKTYTYCWQQPNLDKLEEYTETRKNFRISIKFRVEQTLALRKHLYFITKLIFIYSIILINRTKAFTHFAFLVKDIMIF